MGLVFSWTEVTASIYIGSRELLATGNSWELDKAMHRAHCEHKLVYCIGLFKS